MIKLIALDMDGTLLNDEKEISKRNKDAIEKCIELGVKFTLSTGRPIYGIKKYLKELNLINDNNYSVVLNGAVVQNNGTNMMSYKECLSYDDFYLIKDFLDESNVPFYVCTDKCVYADAYNSYAEYESEVNLIPLITGSFSKLKSEDIIKVVIGAEDNKLDKIEKIISCNFKDKFSITRSASIFFEFMNKKANKGYGVEFLTNLYGYKREEVMCMGDAGNDISMLKFAGLPITLENAFPDAKNIAKYITQSNNDDGVAEALNKFILR